LADEHFNKKFKSGAEEDQKEDQKEGPDSESVPMELESAVEEVAGGSSSSEEPYSFGEGIPDDFRGQYEIMGVVTHKGRSADSGKETL
jgi:hypothetical protein